MMTTRSQPSLFLSPREEFQRTLAPDTLRNALKQSRRESAWKLTHAGSPVHPSEFPTPASSEYHLPLTCRPKSAGISQFTARENRRLEDQSVLASLTSPLYLAGGASSKALKSPTDKDFQRMIDRLQKLQTGNVGNRRILLSEGKSEEVMLEEGEVQFFKICPSGKTCPLKVTVEREKGAIIVYMSRTDAEPGEGADGIFKKDSFVITDPGLRFKTDVLYLAAKALNQVSFFIHIKYGKRGVSSSESNLRSRKEAEQQEEDVRLEDLKRVLKVKSPTYSTNFIKRNLQILPQSSPKFKKELRLKKQQSQDRRQAVLARKQSMLAEKRQRTYLVLHRHELRLEAETKAREIMELIERKEMFEKAWFLLRENFTFTETLFHRFEKRKRELEHAAKLARAATTIQRFFRHLISHLDRKGLALRACRHHFLLFSRQHIRSVRATAKQKIVRTIKLAYKNSILPVAVTRMLNRSKGLCSGTGEASLEGTLREAQATVG